MFGRNKSAINPTDEEMKALDDAVSELTAKTSALLSEAKPAKKAKVEPKPKPKLPHKSAKSAKPKVSKPSSKSPSSPPLSTKRVIDIVHASPKTNLRPLVNPELQKSIEQFKPTKAKAVSSEPKSDQIIVAHKTTPIVFHDDHKAEDHVRPDIEDKTPKETSAATSQDLQIVPRKSKLIIPADSENEESESGSLDAPKKNKPEKDGDSSEEKPLPDTYKTEESSRLELDNQDSEHYESNERVEDEKQDKAEDKEPKDLDAKEVLLEKSEQVDELQGGIEAEESIKAEDDPKELKESDEAEDDSPISPMLPSKNLDVANSKSLEVEYDEANQKATKTVFDAEDYHPQLHDWSKLGKKRSYSWIILLILIPIAAFVAYYVITQEPLPFGL